MILMLNINQSNVKTATAENEEQYTLSNVIHIECQNNNFLL